ncbi:cytochrome c biogenesis CcdA family protein [Streptomyces sp. NPDC005134]|uniref:cytochrome c biogenesis CcdA family protein n=1 Tax=Streptomyces sp. NPDC005098 TaxID=3154560 RepID=UPI0033BC613F
MGRSGGAAPAGRRHDVPGGADLLERPFARIGQRRIGGRRSGFVLGLALGAVYVPCAGPVLAAIAVAGATQRIGVQTAALAVAFAIGTAIPLLFFALSGRRIGERVRAFRNRQRGVRIVAGLTFVLLAFGLTFNNNLEPRPLPAVPVLPGPGVREFYTGLGAAGYQDAFRLLSRDAPEYSWVGRTGDGSFPWPRPGHRSLVERATGVARDPIGVGGLVRAAGIGYIRTSSTGWYASAGARMRAPRGPAGSAHRQRGEVSSS